MIELDWLYTQNEWDKFIATREIFILKTPVFILMTLNENKLVDKFGRHPFLIIAVFFFYFILPSHYIHICFWEGSPETGGQMEALSTLIRTGGWIYRACCERSNNWSQGSQVKEGMVPHVRTGPVQGKPQCHKDSSLLELVFSWTVSIHILMYVWSCWKSLLESADTFGGPALTKEGFRNVKGKKLSFLLGGFTPVPESFTRLTSFSHR